MESHSMPHSSNEGQHSCDIATMQEVGFFLLSLKPES
jgi:hypothetical protein